ncbi:hypothetical protein [Entomobacter blattae]|nr:hypothetical protein [Entomobacter blattae]
MNLNRMAGNVLNSFYPQHTILWLQATGQGRDGLGHRYPIYTPVFIRASIQAVPEDRLIPYGGGAGLASGSYFQQGRLKCLYLSGHGHPLDRIVEEGNDRFIFNAALWQAVQVIEDWGIVETPALRQGGWSQLMVRMIQMQTQGGR